MKKLISALLLVAILVLALAACGGSQKKKTTAATTPSPVTTTPAPGGDDPWEDAASEVKAMDASLRNVIISMSDNSLAVVKNEEYVEGPATRENASNIEGYIYDRNQDAYAKLGMTVRYKYTPEGWGAAYGNIVAACKAQQTADSPDMYVDLMYDMVGAAIGGAFREVTTIPGSYLNFETQGWFSSIMDDVSLDGERKYLLATDYYLDIVRNMLVMPFNLSLLDGSTGDADLVAAITGKDTWSDTNEAGKRQYLSDYLFQIVRDGKWTYDRLTEICEAIFIEQDGVPEDSKGDRNGLLLDAGGGIMSSAFLYSTDVECLIDGKDANGKLTLTYPTTGDKINEVFKATDKLIKADGTFIMPGSSTAEANAQIRAAFSSGKAFAIGAEMLGSFESDEYAGMNDVFSVLPIPLLEEGSVDDHNTPIHNCAALGAINIRSAKYLPLTAFVQYVTEHELTQSVREEYLRVIMKFDLVEYNAGTDEMLEIVYAHTKSCREMIIDNLVYQQKRGEITGVVDPRWHGILKVNQFTEGEFLSNYESVRTAKQAALNTLLATWRTLPTQEAPPAAEETPAGE